MSGMPVLSQQGSDLLKTRKSFCFGVILFGHSVCVHTLNTEVCSISILPTEFECSIPFYTMKHLRISFSDKCVLNDNFFSPKLKVRAGKNHLVLILGPYAVKQNKKKKTV